MVKILLDQPVKVKDQELQALELDFNGLTGMKLLNAESEARSMGDKTPQIMFSMKYQAVIAAKAAQVPFEIIKNLPAGKFQEVIMEVNSFLFSSASENE